VYVFLAVETMIIPLIMFFIGIAWKKHAPKKINYIYGYRTKMSMKNADTWEFAHKYTGRLWYVLGGILTIITSIFILAFMNSESFEEIVLILNYANLAVLISSIFFVEIALKKNFDKQGLKKNNP